MKRVITGTVALAMAFASLAFAGRPSFSPSVPVVHAAPLRHVVGVRGVDYGSSNWSGYGILYGASFTYVTGKWQEPKATCLGTTDESHVFWVGLDGMFINQTVEQGGTFAFCSGTNPYYYAWWEMYPTNYITTLYQIYPGDMMTATVSYASGHFKITVADSTRGKSATVTTTCAANLSCDRETAEWIAEAPTYGTTVGNLAAWTNTKGQSQVGFFGGFAKEAGGKKLPIGQFHNNSIEMVNQSDTYALAAPGSLGKLGQGFQDYWYAEG